MKVDYYKFECRIPYRLEEVHGTLKEAKSAYLGRLNQGYRLGCDIYRLHRERGLRSCDFYAFLFKHKDFWKNLSNEYRSFY